MSSLTIKRCDIELKCHFRHCFASISHSLSLTGDVVYDVLKNRRKPRDYEKNKKTKNLKSN